MQGTERIDGSLDTLRVKGAFVVGKISTKLLHVPRDVALPPLDYDIVDKPYTAAAEVVLSWQPSS